MTNPTHSVIPWASFEKYARERLGDVHFGYSSEELRREPTSAFTVTGSTLIGSAASWAPLDQSEFWTQEISSVDVNPAEQSLLLEAGIKAAFGGYAKRMSEICLRLESVENAIHELSSLVIDLGRKLTEKRQPSICVPLQSFFPEPYEFRKPVGTVVTPAEEGFEAAFFDANLFASGDTEAEALDNLKSVIIDTYKAFSVMEDSKLGPGPLSQKRLLASLIREASSA